MGRTKTYKAPRCIVCAAWDSKRRPCTLCGAYTCTPKVSPNCRKTHDAGWHSE